MHGEQQGRVPGLISVLGDQMSQKKGFFPFIFLFFLNNLIPFLRAGMIPPLMVALKSPIPFTKVRGSCPTQWS